MARLKPYLQIAGWVLVALSFAFIGWKLYHEVSFESIVARGFNFIVLIVVAAMIYGAAGVLLAEAWFQISCIIDNQKSSRRNLHALYAVTQIAKYIPGNVFQFAGRHARMHGQGFLHTEAGLLALLETTGLILAALIPGLAGGFRYVDEAGGVRSILPGIAVALLLPVVGYFVIHRARRLQFRHSGNRFTTARRLLIAIFLYILFFIIAGLLLTALAGGSHGSYDSILNPLSNKSVALSMIALFSISWLVGYVVPGASAGAGVREAILIMGLQNIIPASDAILVTIAMRMVTIMGDVLFFIYGLLMQKNLTESH